MKKGVLGKIIAIAITTIIVLVSAVVIKSESMVDCSTCKGSGKTYIITCSDCDGSGKDKNNSDCSACEGETFITATEDSTSVDFLNSGTSNTVREQVCADCEGSKQVPADSWYYATIMSLFPAFVAIALALITKEVYSSLFIGILLGGLLNSNWNPVGAINTVLNDGIIFAVKETSGIFIFLVILGVMVALINKAGGSQAFGRWAETHIKSRAGAMLATFVLGVLIFIDDYFNCLTVGSVMRPVTDRHKISRAKLAYLIDATAAPICMIAPISSWAAAVSEYTKGTGYSGIELFIRAIPYNFYSLLTFVFVIGIVLMKFDYGPMKIHEFNAMNKGDLHTSDEKVDDIDDKSANQNGRIIDLIFPVLILVITCILGLLYVGGLFSGASFIQAFGDTEASLGLPLGALIALVITIIYLMLRRIVTFKDAMECIPKGFIAMVPAILILTFAASLKNMTTLLNSKGFVEGVMASAGALKNFLPAIIFVVACVISFSTGTSWGTFGILIPIVTGVFPVSNPLMFIGMSACLAGSVCGDHCSPISDTTIMSSAGAQSNHLNHVSTQMPYALTVAGISFVMYLLAAFIQSAYVLLPIGAVLTIATLAVIKKVTADK